MRKFSQEICYVQYDGENVAELRELIRVDNDSIEMERMGDGSYSLPVLRVDGSSVAIPLGGYLVKINGIVNYVDRKDFADLYPEEAIHEPIKYRKEYFDQAKKMMGYIRHDCGLENRFESGQSDELKYPIKWQDKIAYQLERFGKSDLTDKELEELSIGGYEEVKSKYGRYDRYEELSLTIQVYFNSIDESSDIGVCDPSIKKSDGPCC